MPKTTENTIAPKHLFKRDPYFVCDDDDNIEITYTNNYYPSTAKYPGSKNPLDLTKDRGWWEDTLEDLKIYSMVFAYLKLAPVL